MIVVYIAGPYRDERGEFFVRRNIRRAEELAVAVWLNGMVALCPHKNTAGLGGVAPDHAWLEGDLELLKRCDVLVTVDGWKGSSGARAEVKFARENDIPVFHELSSLVVWVAGIG